MAEPTVSITICGEPPTPVSVYWYSQEREYDVALQLAVTASGRWTVDVPLGGEIKFLYKCPSAPGTVHFVEHAWTAPTTDPSGNGLMLVDPLGGKSPC